MLNTYRPRLLNSLREASEKYRELLPRLQMSYLGNDLSELCERMTPDFCHSWSKFAVSEFHLKPVALFGAQVA